MRTPPKLGSYLTFMDFNNIQQKPLEFAVAILNTIDIDKRTKMIINLSQDKPKDYPFYMALEESLIYTLCREIKIGCESKHSRKFNFDDFTCFISTVKEQIKKEKHLQIKGLEELFLRLKYFSEK